VVPEVHVVPEIIQNGVVPPPKTDAPFQLQKTPIQMKLLQESSSESGSTETAISEADSFDEEKSSIMSDTFTNLKPETQCDTLDLGCYTVPTSHRGAKIEENSEEGTGNIKDNVPAILLSPASNEGTDFGENEQTLDDQCNNESEEETENTKETVQLMEHDNGEEKINNSSEEENPSVGPIIQVTDCDTEKSNSSGLIAASCIIAR